MPARKVTTKNPLHILLLLDNSGSMEGSASLDVNRAVDALATELVGRSQGGKPYFKLSLIRFGSNPEVVFEVLDAKQLVSDPQRCIDGQGGSTNAAAALDEAAALLKRHPGASTDFEPLVMFLSDGEFDDANAAVQAAGRLKSLQIAAGSPRIITLGFGSASDQVMRQVASNSEVFGRLPTPAALARLLPVIGSSTLGTTGGADEMLDVIAESMEEVL